MQQCKTVCDKSRKKQKKRKVAIIKVLVKVTVFYSAQHYYISKASVLKQHLTVAFG